MTRVEAWLGGRRPAPPAELDLRPWLEDGLPEAGGGQSQGRLDAPASTTAFDPAGGEAEAVHGRLLRAGLAALAQAAARPGRVRESAFHLLAADALLTYACEAALESTDPEAALLRTLEAGFGR